MSINAQKKIEQAAVAVRNLSVQRAGSVILRDISFSALPGDFIAIVGPNGSGKSTLLQTILGYIPPSSGTVLLFGEPPDQFAEWSRIGYLPQVLPQTVAGLPVTAQEIVAMGLLSDAASPGRRKREEAERVLSALARVQMERFADRKIGELSGGQRHRVFLARALVADPALLILDEPTASLDPSFRFQFYEILRAVQEEKQTTILLVTHDSAAAGLAAKKLLYLDQKVIFFGTFKAFCESSEMAGYFGKAFQHQICHQHDTHDFVV